MVRRAAAFPAASSVGVARSPRVGVPSILRVVSGGRWVCAGVIRMASVACFGPKMAVFGPKLQFLKLRSATCESRSRPPPLSFLLKLCVIVLHTHRFHPPKFHPNLTHHDGNLIFTHFACAAACCLLLLAAACCCCC